MEGKKKYFALVLFLFLGLMIFTFANPAEEEKEFQNGDKDQSETVTDRREETTEEDDTDEQEQQDVLNVVTDQNQGNNQQNVVTDNSLRDALAAVEKAEGTYTQEDVNAAKDLVNNVTDTTEKGKLEDRLEEVEAGIAVLALLEDLEKQVEDAEEKAHMTDATAYRDNNKISDKIDALNNETVKEELAKRLTTVSKLLDDNAAPVASVEAKAYNDHVEITAEDEAGNPFKMYLTKGNGKEKEITSGDKTTSEGVYTLRLIDEAFNEQTVTFTVDTTAPALKDLTSGAHYPKITLTVEDLTKTKIEVTNMDKNETTEVEDGTKLTEDATYKVILTDEAGNTAEYWLAIDSLKPTISVKDEVVEENAYINENTEVKVFDKFLTNVSITYEDAKAKKTIEEFTRVDFIVGERNENFTLTYELTKVGTYTITGTDKYGNEKTVKVTYDKTVAKKKVVNANVSGYDNLESHQYAINGKTITAYFNINEELKHNPTFTFYANGKKIAEVKDEVIKSASTNKDYPHKYTATLKIDKNLEAENGLITFTITDIYDKAGNKTEDITAMTRSDKVITLDRTLPKSTYVAILSNKTENHKYVTNGQLVRVLAAFDEEIKVTKDFVLTINGKNYKFQRSQDTTKFEYIVEFRIPENETSMPEGEVQFAISGYQDIAGNKATEPLTKATHYKYNTLKYDRTEAEITLPGQEGKDKNQYRILKDSYVEINTIAAKFNDAVDGTGEILPKEIWAFYPAVMNKTAHKYDLLEQEVDRNKDGVKEIEKYFDTSIVGVNYRVTYEYKDKAGIVSTKNMLLIVDAPYEPEITNNEINLNYNLTLNDKPFYNNRERTEPLTINGNGKTITQEIDTAYKYTWDITGTRPMQSNIFTSANNSLVTVNNLNFAGTMYSITLGHYRSSNQAAFTTVLNNVNVINTKVASFSAGVSPAMSIYGKATLNNVNVYGTTLSELDTNPKWPVYDVIMVNNTDTTINGGKIGTIFTWPKAYLEINNAEIGTIDTQIEYRNDYKKAGLVIGENTKVEKIIIKENKAVLTVKSTAEVGVLDLCANEETNMYLNIEPGAKIGKVIVKDGDSCKEMTYDEWYKLITTPEKLDTAMKLGGELKLINDIKVAKIIEQPATSHVVLDMNGKKLTLKDASVDPMIDMKTGSSLVIKGNGTVDLEKNYFASFIAPRGDVTIENGNFLRAVGPAGTKYGSFFIGINGGKGKLIIKDGYFDGGYYKEGDEFNNSRNLLNGSWGQYVRVYGGTFVGQNPAYGDEGMAYTNPNSTSTYCQSIFFEGQSRLDTEIPSTYKVEKGTLADGRPTYKVTYTPAE